MGTNKKAENPSKARLASLKGRKPVILVTGVEPGREVTIPASKLDTLQIDERYQRAEIKRWVNELITVLLAGGQVPDPISIAVRPDGSHWIVDGQQRYWAHWHCERPIRAKLYRVETYEQELALFHALNATKTVNANVLVGSWPGPAGDLLHWLNESPESPLREEVHFAPGAPKWAATIVARMVCSALGESDAPFRAVKLVMGAIDRHVERAKRTTYKRAQMNTLLAQQVFEGAVRVPMIPAVALARLAAERWAGVDGSGSYPMPDTRTIRRLQQTPWEKLTAGTYAKRFLPTVMEELAYRWP